QHSISTLDSMINCATLKLRQILAGKSDDGWRVLAGDGHIVSCAGLVTIRGTPNHHVGQSAEVSKSFNGLVSRTVFSKTNRVVGGDVDDTDSGKRRKTNGTSGIGDEVEESTTSRDNGSV